MEQKRVTIYLILCTFFLFCVIRCVASDNNFLLDNKNHIKNNHSLEEIPLSLSNNAYINDIKADLKNKNISINEKKETIVNIFNNMFPNSLCYITDIDISHNQLTHLPLTCITTLCPNLNNLNASYNNIKYISLLNDEKQHTQCKTVYVHNNDIASLELSHLLFIYPNLSLIDISHNPLKNIHVQPMHFTQNAPKLVLHNTVLSLQEKKILWNRYNDVMKMPYYKTIIVPTLCSGFFSGIITKLIESYVYDMEDANSTNIAFGIATVSGIMTSLYMYYVKYEKLKEIEQDVRNKLIFNDPTIIKRKLIKS